MKFLASGMYKPPSWQWLLLPLMLLFAVLSAARRILYRIGVLSIYKSQIPVIVIGNITMGGNGKTPIVAAMIEHFLRLGRQPAVLSRGYGGNCDKHPYLVGSDDAAAVVGDEPAMIKRRYDIPIIIDPKRARGLKFIEDSVDADVIICDDGLQHYALGRDVELCVMDERGVGNGYLLPIGPLRENIWRLNTVDLVLVNGNKTPSCLNSISTQIHNFVIQPTVFRNVKTGETLSIAEGCQYFSSVNVLAIAGIGHPKRFFSTLASLNIVPDNTKGFPDHYVYLPQDLTYQGTIVMTEKDAIKCKELAGENCWYLQISAEVPTQVFDYVDQNVNKRSMQTHNTGKEHVL